MKPSLKKILVYQRDILRFVGKNIPYKLILRMQWSVIKAMRFISLPRIEYSCRVGKQRILNDYLAERYGDMVPQTLSFRNVEGFEDTCPIWVFWWQGWDGPLPPVVDMCRNQLKKVAGQHEIIWLDKHNTFDYVTLPAAVREAFDRGDFTITHLSDIVRTALLATHGGLWLDSTMLTLTDPVRAVTKTPMWGTIKIHPLTEGEISDYRWGTFCLFSYPDNNVMKFFYDAMCRYISDGHRMFLDYLLIDFFMELLYRRNQEFRHIVDTLPYSHENLHLLEECLPLPPPYMPDFQQTTIFKLNRRFVPGAEETVYHRLLKMLDGRPMA